MQLIKTVLLSEIITATAGAAGQTAINSSVVDVSQGIGCLFMIRFGAITAGAVTSIKIQHGDTPTLSDAADLLGTGQTIADTDDEKWFYVDLSRPIKRYARLVVSRGTQNAVVSTAIAQVYGAKLQPTTQATGFSGETHIGEQAGTA